MAFKDFPKELAEQREREYWEERQRYRKEKSSPFPLEQRELSEPPLPRGFAINPTSDAAAVMQRETKRFKEGRQLPDRSEKVSRKKVKAC